jgi:hypothetical protein
MLSCGCHHEFHVVQTLSADDVVLKRAKRDKLLATHPDKLGTETIGANLAVGRVTQVPDTSCAIRCGALVQHCMLCTSSSTPQQWPDKLTHT